MSVTQTPDVSVPAYTFLPAEFRDGGPGAADPAAIVEQTERLLVREPATPKELEAWVRDWSELQSAVSGAAARRYIAMTCDTTDEAAKEAHLTFEREVWPTARTQEDRLVKAFLANPHRAGLGEEFAILVQRTERAAELFREANNPLKAREAELDAEYNGIQGAITVKFRGETLTAQQAGAHLEDLDRATREEAWRLVAARRLVDRERIEEIFEEDLELRGRQAENASFENYRDFKFAEMCRFDYTPADCAGFHAAVEKVVVPAAQKLMEKRQRILGLDSLRPWDLTVSTSGRPPLEPFQDESGYHSITRKLFRAVDPVFEGEYDILERNNLLDLMSRPGKAPGGYNYGVEDIRLPFIFINAVGRHGDVQTMLHEGGHAFHSLAVRDFDVADFRDPPTEFCEVASMSMEMLAMEHFPEAYSADDARDAAVSHLNDVVTLMPWIAIIDAFQHWLYTHPGHSAEERRATWVGLRTRFTPWIDWSGLEAYRDHEWQRQGHLFGMAFYYIEYAIAQIGALQVWRNARKDEAATIKQYRGALKLGATKSLPELFAAAGAKFAMDDEILGVVIPEAVARIEALEA